MPNDTQNNTPATGETVKPLTRAESVERRAAIAERFRTIQAEIDSLMPTRIKDLHEEARRLNRDFDAVRYRGGTELPWTLIEEDCDVHDIFGWFRLQSNAAPQPITGRNEDVIGSFSCRRADARLIVTAVNCHEELLAAIKEFVALYAGARDMVSPPITAMLARADAAIQKADPS